MCGIAGYAGTGAAAPFLSQALTRLEYRGYDSWGAATLQGTFHLCKGLGAPSQSPPLSLPGKLGIAHTRWATHGSVSTENCHPVAGTPPPPFPAAEVLKLPTVQVVHNGVIDNYLELKADLQKLGVVFHTETDTEVIAHLLALHLEQVKNTNVTTMKVRKALREACQRLKGQYAFVALWKDFDEGLFLAVNGSPLLVSEDGYVASDATALSGYCRKACRLEDGMAAILYVQPMGGRLAVWENFGERFVFYTNLYEVDVPQLEAEQEEVGHHMLREICEQPQVVRDLALDHAVESVKRSMQPWTLFGCGSSYNAALLGRRYLERLGNVQARVEYATEMDTPVEPNHGTFLALTQSGETRDTLEAIARLRDRAGNLPELVVLTNNLWSSAARLGQVIPLACGPERGVAATKTFTAQAVRLYQLARHIGGHNRDHTLREVGALSQAIEEVVDQNLEILELARWLEHWHSILYLGRGLHYAVAREGALKMMEIAYRHAQAMPASEMKHGPLALIDDCVLSVVLLSSEDADHLPKIAANVSEIRSRGGAVLVIGEKQVCDLAPASDRRLVLPSVSPMLQPLVTNVALQLLAYHVASSEGLPVDRPRNLAKSVTV